ncbi:MAG: glycosyltransferase family 4 protein [Solirubrobacterales bacterium]
MLPQRIGINLLYLVPGKVGGTEIYARELIHELACELADHELVVFVVREAEAPLKAEGWPENVSIRVLPVNGANKPMRALAELFLLPWFARRERVRFMHSMGTTGAPFTPGVRVVTVHDLIFHHHPETFPGPAQKGLELLVPLGARRSQRVLADSQATKDDLIETYEIDGEKIDVVLLGFGHSQSATPTDAVTIRKRFKLGDSKVVLCVASSLAHKNVPRLIDAYAEAFGSVDDRPVLVVAGHAGLGQEHLVEQVAALGIADSVRFTGWVENEDLEGLYAVADVFAYPTLREGFGMPVLEAMARNTPVVCSNTSSVPEVAGDAAIKFDPMNTTAIGNAIKRVLDDDALADELRIRGKARVKDFTWTASATATIGSYMRAIGADQSDGHN